MSVTSCARTVCGGEGPQSRQPIAHFLHDHDMTVRARLKFVSIPAEAYPQMYADVVFVMDSSYDVDPEADYTKQKDLVKRMARNLEVSKGKARAAVITYGNSAPLVSRFESDASLEELYSVVDGAPYVGGMRRLDRALESVIRLTNEARENAPKVVVLFAAGGQESDAGLRSLADASQVLRDAGVQVVVVAVGSGVNMDQLRLVAEQQNIVVVASFEELPAKAEALSLRVEQSSGKICLRVVVESYRLLNLGRGRRGGG